MKRQDREDKCSVLYTLLRWCSVMLLHDRCAVKTDTAHNLIYLMGKPIGLFCFYSAEFYSEICFILQNIRKSSL